MQDFSLRALQIFSIWAKTVHFQPQFTGLEQGEIKSSKVDKSKNEVRKSAGTSDSKKAGKSPLHQRTARVKEAQLLL